MRWLHDLLLASGDPGIADVRVYPEPEGGVNDLAVLGTDGVVIFLRVVCCTAPGDDRRLPEVIVTRDDVRPPRPTFQVFEPAGGDE